MKRLLLFACLICTIVIGCTSTPMPEGEDFIKTGDDLPRFEVDMNDGSKAYSDNMYDGILVFFRTGEEESDKILEYMQRLKNEYQSKPYISLSYLLIGIESNMDELNSYWKKKNFSLRFAAQPDKEIYKMFTSKSTPRLYIIADRKIRFCLECPTYNAIKDAYEEIYFRNINATTISGEWLINGKTQNKITIERQDRKFVIESANGKLQGEFMLEVDSKLGTIIRGIHTDFEGKKYDWCYIIDSLDAKKMQWISIDGKQTHKFERYN